MFLSVVKEKIIAPIFHLMFPHLCAGCSSDILCDDEFICYKCFEDSPVTNFALFNDNVVEKKFWGRINFEAATAEFYFGKDSVMKNIIYELKYKNHQQLGIYLGELMGKSLLNNPRFKDIDAIIPLPLHKEKQKKRGYNQAALLAHGIGNILKIPVEENKMIRSHKTETQTKKSTVERWENVRDKFEVLNHDLMENRHFLMVDDVMTTGATIDACANELLKVAGVRVSLAFLAVASS